MKSKKVLFLLVCCFTAFSAKAQTEVPASNVKTIRLNCPDSLGYVTNTASPYRACEFYFHHKDPAPNIFYVENFTHMDFHELIYKNDKSKIAKVKLVLPNYKASVHDFVYCYNKQNQLLFYYILKDSQEEKLLNP